MFGGETRLWCCEVELPVRVRRLTCGQEKKLLNTFCFRMAALVTFALNVKLSTSYITRD